jgi:hypothetical protein
MTTRREPWKALEHYASYLKAVDRDERAYRELADS